MGVDAPLGDRCLWVVAQVQNTRLARAVLIAGAGQDEAKELLGADDAARCDHPALADEKSKRRSEDFITPGKSETLLQRHREVWLIALDPSLDRFGVMIVNHRYLYLAGMMEPVILVWGTDTIRSAK